MSLFDDEFSELAEAVYAGNLIRAEAALDMMQAAGVKDEAIRRAKRRARPEIKAKLPGLAKPFVLPVPGAKPGDTLAGTQLPRLDRGTPPSGRSRRGRRRRAA